MEIKLGEVDEYDSLMKKGAKEQSGTKAEWTSKDAAALWRLFHSAQTQLQVRSESVQVKKRLIQGLKTISMHHPDVAICIHCNAKYYLGLK